MVELKEILKDEKDILVFLNAHKNEIVELIFETGLLNSYDKSSFASIPRIESWKFIYIDKFFLDLEIKFSSPLIVSKGSQKDIIKVKVLNENLFQSLRSGNYIPKNYTTNLFIVPRQFHQEDMEYV